MGIFFKAVFCLLALALPLAQVQAAPALRVSTENADNHPQTQALKDFVALANERLGGSLTLTLYPSGKLFRGKDVIKAVAAGHMEIAVPGIWHMSKLVPDFNLFLLPRFYGVTAAENYKIREGNIGRRLNERIESSLNVQVLGRWIDLGYANIFTAKKQVKSPADMKGLIIRVAGGKGNEARIEAMGAKAVSIPWPDFPAILERGDVDGTLTTAATINSVKLWEKGIKYAYLDRQYFPQYVPLISRTVWSRLSESQKQAIASAWDDIVDASRLRAAAFQDEALATLKQNGVVVVEPDQAQINKTKQQLMPLEPKLIKDLNITVLE